jgi:hypothetical protein
MCEYTVMPSMPRSTLSSGSGSTSHGPVADGCGQGVLVDDRTACGVDEQRGRLHQAQCSGIDQVTGGGSQSGVDGHDVRAGEQGVEVDELHFRCW